MSALIDQNIHFEIETLKTEVQQLKKYMIEALQANTMAVQSVSIIESMQQFVEKVDFDNSKINDDLEKMRKKLDVFEKSKWQLENVVKDLQRRMPAKKVRLDNNFLLSPTSKETLNDGMQTRALVAMKSGTTSAGNNKPSRRASRNLQDFKNDLVSQTQKPISTQKQALLNIPVVMSPQLEQDSLRSSVRSTLSPKPSRQPRRFFTEKRFNIKFNNEPKGQQMQKYSGNIGCSQDTTNFDSFCTNASNSKMQIVENSQTIQDNSSKPASTRKTINLQENKIKKIKQAFGNDNKAVRVSQSNYKVEKPLEVQTQVSLCTQTEDPDSSNYITCQSPLNILDFQYTPAAKGPHKNNLRF